MSAKCKQCGKSVGCSCELINGYCKACWNFLQQVKNNVFRNATNNKYKK